MRSRREGRRGKQRSSEIDDKCHLAIGPALPRLEVDVLRRGRGALRDGG